MAYEAFQASVFCWRNELPLADLYAQTAESWNLKKHNSCPLTKHTNGILTCMYMHKHYCMMKNIYHACRHFAFPAIIASSHTLKPHTAHRCKPRAHCADSPCLFSLLHHMTALILLSLDLHRGDSRTEPRSGIPPFLLGLEGIQKTSILQKHRTREIAKCE